MRLGAVVLILTTITFLGCREEAPQTPPIISSFEPTSGLIGTLVTIRGGNFGEGPQVFLNDIPLELNAVADDQIMVTITAGASTGKIKVVNNGAETVTSDDFVVLSLPTITGFTPNGGGSNDPVTMTGTNFIEGTTVLFGEVSAPVLSLTSTSISTIVPLNSFPAKIRVTTSAGSALSSAIFAANPPAITSVKAFYSQEPLTVVSPGQLVTITTTHFNVDAPRSLAFNGIPLVNVEYGSPDIKAEIPAGVQTGKFTITVNDYTVTYDPLITVISGAGEWTNSVEFPGSIIAGAAGFKIGDYYYYGIGTQLNAGHSGSSGITNEFWKFNPATESWTPMPPTPAVSTSDAMSAAGTFSFAVKGQGYVSGGADFLNRTSKEFYRFDPVAESWTKMADISDELAQPSKNFGFSANDKGYVLNINSGAVNEYDPDNDTWTVKSTVPGTLPFFFLTQYVSSNKAYIVLARPDSQVNELWEYDPAGNTWTHKKDYPGTGYAIFGFEIEGNGYVGSFSGSFWKYDPNMNDWVELPPMPSPLTGPAFSFGKKGYVNASLGFSFPSQGYSRLSAFQIP